MVFEESKSFESATDKNMTLETDASANLQVIETSKS